MCSSLDRVRSTASLTIRSWSKARRTALRSMRSHYVESVKAKGRPSATRVLELVGRFGRAPARQMPGVGLGIEHRIVSGCLTGQALALNGAVVHATFSRETREGGNYHG